MVSAVAHGLLTPTDAARNAAAGFAENPWTLQPAPLST